MVFIELGGRGGSCGSVMDLFYNLGQFNFWMASHNNNMYIVELVIVGELGEGGGGY